MTTSFNGSVGIIEAVGYHSDAGWVPFYGYCMPTARKRWLIGRWLQIQGSVVRIPDMTKISFGVRRVASSQFSRHRNDEVLSHREEGPGHCSISRASQS